MSEYRKGYVYVQRRYAGMISETETGYSFQYDAGYLGEEKVLPVSLTMPLQQEPYVSGTLFPFFDGLIPEGWTLDVVCRSWKISHNDRFAVLLAACRDSIGDVQIMTEVQR